MRSVLALGREVYEFNCYFCHGYRGDAHTVAAQNLRPPPLNFWRAENLTTARIEKAVRGGRKGTAMPSFAARLSDEEIRAVAVYVASGLAGGAAYHTAANGWPDHEKRNGAAFPFVRGEISPDAPDDALTAEERAGRDLFRGACAICHSSERSGAPAAPFRSADGVEASARQAEPKALPDAPGAPRRRTGDCSRCHDDFDSNGNPLTRTAAGYEQGPHDVIPEIIGLTPAERRGRDLYQSACADCHAADGSGANWVGTFLAQSPTDFRSPAFAARYRRDDFVKSVLEGRKDSSMPSFAAVLNANEAADIAQYVERAFVENPQSPGRGK